MEGVQDQDQVAGEIETIDEVVEVERGSPGQDPAPETETTSETDVEDETSLLHTKDRQLAPPDWLR